MGLPRKIHVSQVLKLVEQFSPEEHDEFMREIKLKELKHEIQMSLDQLDNGNGIPGEQVFSKLRANLIKKTKMKSG